MISSTANAINVYYFDRMGGAGGGGVSINRERKVMAVLKLARAELLFFQHFPDKLP